jgi:hypothetical protein
MLLLSLLAVGPKQRAHDSGTVRTAPEPTVRSSLPDDITHDRAEHPGRKDRKRRSGASYETTAAKSKDKALAGATALLIQVGVKITAPIETFGGPNLSGGSSVTQGATDGKTIRINMNTRSYKDALKGDARELAGSLAHEQWHVAHGPDEAGAYDEQLRVLRALGAKPHVIRDTQNARAQVMQ